MLTQLFKETIKIILNSGKHGINPYISVIAFLLILCLLLLFLANLLFTPPQSNDENVEDDIEE